MLSRLHLPLLLIATLFSALSCSGENATRDTCQDHCADLVFFDCVSSAELQACSRSCESSSVGTATNFNRCMEKSALCDGITCLHLLSVEAEKQEPNHNFHVDRCKDTCTELLACIDSAEVQECLAACEVRSTSQLKSFTSCRKITNTCQENSRCRISLGL